MSRFSLRKGSKSKPQHETETSFNESGGSAVSGAQAALPDLVASDTPPSVRGSGSLVTSPLSPPSSLSGEVLSPVRTSGASETSISKAERKKLAEAAEKKRKTEKKEREAEKKARQEAVRKAEKEKKKKGKEEKDSKKSKGKKHDAKSLQDERSLHSEDWQPSSTLVASQHAATPQHTPIPGAGYSQDMSGGRDALEVKSRHESGTASGVSVHGPHSIALETYEAEPRSVLSSSFDAGGFEEVRQSYQNTIDDLTHDLEAAKEESKKARDELEQELRRKDDELRTLQMRKESELEEALEKRDRTTREELRQKENELKLKEEEFQVAMQAKTEEYRNLLRKQMEVKQREVSEKQKETERLQARLNQKEKESAAANIVFKQEGELQSLRKEVEQKKNDMELQKRQHEIALKQQGDRLQALLTMKERDRKRSESEGKEAVRTRESALQKVKEELKQKSEEFEVERGVQQELLQASIQSEQRLRDIHLQMEKQKQEHTREMESAVKEQQALIDKMKTDHQAEVETLQQQKDQALREVLQQRRRESGERMAGLEEAQARHVQELKEKDARIRQLEAERQKQEREIANKDRGLRETVQQRRGESAGRITELETQHAKELTEKDAKIRQLEAEGRKRHREVMDESKKEQELQVKIQGMEKQHKKELEEKNRLYQRAIDEMRKSQENALTMQSARIERRVETEQKKKLQETLDSAKTELEQAATDKAKAEIQRKETELQAALAKSKEELQLDFQAAMQQRDREFEARIAKLRSRPAQELVGKDLKIHQLQEEAAEFIPSSEPPDEDQYDKLLKNYEAMGVDRGFMVESMTVLKKRNEELVSELQQCKIQLEIHCEDNVKRLETDIISLKAENAQRVEISALQVALSEAEHERQSLHHKYSQEKERCERAERECIDQGVTVASLKDEMERLMRENHEFKDEIEIRQHEIEFTKQDFIAERHDREQAAECYSDEKARMIVENQELTGHLNDRLRDIDMYKGEIDKLKGELTHQGELERNFEGIQMEFVRLREQADAHKAQQTAMKQELEESHQKLEENIANSSKLHDDVLVKTQQMKQYKKQVDGYKVQNGELKAEMDGLKAELGVYQQQAMQYREQLSGAQQLASNMEALQRERDTLAAQLQMLKGRKSSESEFATAFQKEFDRRDELEKQNERLRAYCDQEKSDCVRLQQQLQRQEEEARQQLQLLQQRMVAALAEFQHSQHSPQITPMYIPRQEVEAIKEIGRGAWGTVYKGKFQGQSVAVKSLHPEILDEHTIERLRREVQIMAQVRHPNLLRFIGAVFNSQMSHQNPPLIVLELLDTDLRMAYQTKQIQGSSKIPIFRDIAYALHYLHELHEPIIHRDVSAPNVLLEALPSGMWRAKVSDFGSANLAKLAKTMAEGAIIYAAPETIPHELSSRPPPQTTKIDVFSYGVLLCEVIMSQLPDRDRFWIMLQRVEQQWPLMHRLILSCIKQKAAERPTMAEILDQLNTLPRPKPN